MIFAALEEALYRAFFARRDFLLIEGCFRSQVKTITERAQA